MQIPQHCEDRHLGRLYLNLFLYNSNVLFSVVSKNCIASWMVDLWQTLDEGEIQESEVCVEMCPESLFTQWMPCYSLHLTVSWNNSVEPQ